MALARAKLADSARHVADRARPTDASIDQSRDLAYIEAMFRNMVGDRSEALSQLALYLATNPAERGNLAKDDTWWWNGLREDPKFKDLVGAK